MTTTYTKLANSGEWGVRVEFRGKGGVAAGDKVEVRKRSGERKLETIDRVAWQGGNVFICSIVPTARPVVASPVVGQDEMRQIAAGARCGRYDDGAPIMHRAGNGQAWVEY